MIIIWSGRLGQEWINQDLLLPNKFCIKYKWEMIIIVKGLDSYKSKNNKNHCVCNTVFVVLFELKTLLPLVSIWFSKMWPFDYEIAIY